MTTLTTEQTKDLVDEFVKFVIDDWTAEQLQSYVYDSLKQEIVCTRNHLPLEESLKEQIDEYDDNLYELLIPYVQDREGYDVENAELSMRLYDSELTENVECDMEHLL